jgi:hypothetical protein
MAKSIKLANVQALVDARKNPTNIGLVVGGDWVPLVVGGAAVRLDRGDILSVEGVDNLQAGQADEIVIQYRVQDDGQVLKRIASVHRI